MEILGGSADYENKFTVFTDGSALNNKSEAPAGWAVYIPRVKKLLSKPMIGTNNQAELEAMRYALWFIKMHLPEYKIEDKMIYVFSDSEYVINTLNNKWKAKENLAKIKVCRMLVQDMVENGYNIEFIHAKAHTKKKDFISLNNDIVDQEARRRANEMKGMINNKDGGLDKKAWIPDNEQWDEAFLSY